MATAKKIPTEREVLRCIYDLYGQKYEAESSLKPVRQTVVPIELQAVATKLGINKYVLFGYLYYHLDAKYKYPTGENAAVHLFMPTVGELRNGINFPYLAAVLAGQEEQHTRELWAVRLSVVAIILSVGSLIAQVAVG
ncbi:hypothetical protein ACWKWK_15710 [Pseudoxanthomonas beigongshangi]